MKFDVITIFPEIFKSYLKETLISRAIKRQLINFEAHNLRNWSQDRRRTIDDRPFGGGLGMIMKIEPILKAVIDLKKDNNFKSKTIVFTPRGKKFNQKMAYNFSKLDQLIMICGRYEGVDERVAKYIADEEISIGDYILMGGELPAMIVTEAVTRLIPGVTGKDSFLDNKIKKKQRSIQGMIEMPQYTRPEIFEIKKIIAKDCFRKNANLKIKNKKLKDIVNSKWRVPKKLISGNHKEINQWRENKGKVIWK